jgi:hypothetical protein
MPLFYKWRVIMLELVRESPTNIPQRVKELDPAVIVVYNDDRGMFELHHYSDGLLGRFEKVDAQMITFLNKTQKKFAKQIISEMKEHNAKLQDKNQWDDELRYKSKEIIKFYDHHPSCDKIEEIRW